MVATANKGLEQPARGSNVGVWDTPMNANAGIIDNSFGGVATVALTNSNVILSSAQYQCVFLNFTGTITANIIITMPNVGSFYTVQNRTVGNFTVTLATTVSGGEGVGCPPYEPFDIMTDGTNVRFRNFGRVGSYWDYGGSSSPLWLAACTVPPYLNCDGTTFSSATYPALATVLGGTTLPDSRGRARFVLNQGQSRITSGSSTGGLDGNTLFAAAGAQTTTLSSQNMPSILVTDPGHYHETFASTSPGSSGTLGSTSYAAMSLNSGLLGAYIIAGTAATYPTVGRGSSDATGITAGSTAPTNFSAIPPAYVGGMTFIRSA